MCDVICSNCAEEIDDWVFSCDHPCSTEEIWWCDVCGSFAVTWNGDKPEADDWHVPSYTKSTYNLD